MNRTLAVIAAAVCLGAGAVGCSSSSKTNSSAPSDGPAASSPAASAPAQAQGCNPSAMKVATRTMSQETPALNEALSGADVKVTGITSDDACDIVIQTNAKAGDAKAKQALQPLDQGFSSMIPKNGGQSPIKGLKITAADGSAVYQQSAAK